MHGPIARAHRTGAERAHRGDPGFDHAVERAAPPAWIAATAVSFASAIGAQSAPSATSGRPATVGRAAVGLDRRVGRGVA